MDNKDGQNKKIGEVKYDVVHETTTTSLGQKKSGGNTPSGLDAVKKKQIPQSQASSSTRTNLARPNGSIPQDGLTDRPVGKSNVSGGRGSTSRGSSPVGRKPVRQSNPNRNAGSSSKSKPGSTLDKNKRKNNRQQLDKQNPNLNQNKFKNFGRKNTPKNPTTNPSAKFTSKGMGKGLFNGKAPFGVKGANLLSGLSRKKKNNDGTSVGERVQKAKASIDFVRIFMALPIAVKIALLSFLGGFILIAVVAVIILGTQMSSSDGNREMKDSYIYGDYSKEELCEYLERNGYLDGESNETIKCEDSDAYKFFVNFKDIKEEYEDKYKQYRFSVNVELLYETMVYHKSDEEAFPISTKGDMVDLVEASLEQIEESCVIKSYDKVKQICNTTKYVYPLYEISLNKYISYLKYGETSSHPNYHDNLVKRKCGEGTNVDYVFGYGLVNTSSSPLTESSNCPNNPVKPSDYEDSSIPVKKTTLEEMDILGGVPYFSRINSSTEVSDQVEIPGSSGGTGSNPNPPIDVKGTGTGVDIAKYALQFVGNPYVWGGTSLTDGADCSGFIMSVYAHFNYSLPHSSEGIAHKGTEVACNPSSLQPGDVVAYGSGYNDIGHIALYVGDGKVVHAMGAKYGIVVSNYDYSSKKYKVCKRLVN